VLGQRGWDPAQASAANSSAFLSDLTIKSQALQVGIARLPSKWHPSALQAFERERGMSIGAKSYTRNKMELPRRANKFFSYKAMAIIEMNCNMHKKFYNANKNDDFLNKLLLLAFG